MRRAMGEGNFDQTHCWPATTFAQHRKRLGLLAANVRRVLGVSALTVYRWESGQSHPRSKQLEIASMRGMSNVRRQGVSRNSPDFGVRWAIAGVVARISDLRTR
jgi:DNA-binding transcriptional regulator YiaG